MMNSGKDAGKATKKKPQDHRENATISKYFTTSDIKKRKRSSLSPTDSEPHLLSTKKRTQESTQKSNGTLGLTSSPKASNDLKLPTSASIPAEPHIPAYLKKIQLSSKTPFQKRVLTALCQVPRGRYTTYGAMASHLKSSARAVGNAMRENPFAPQVPCHRVLATGGGLGGFMGSWGRKGEEGKNDHKKLSLLRGEGVMFDGKGKVVGSVWEAFV